MAYLKGSAYRIFRAMAEKSEAGSRDEALFSGLASLAMDVDLLRLEEGGQGSQERGSGSPPLS